LKVKGGHLRSTIANKEKGQRTHEIQGVKWPKPPRGQKRKQAKNPPKSMFRRGAKDVLGKNKWWKKTSKPCQDSHVQ
jgi:hypothetical protein